MSWPIDEIYSLTRHELEQLLTSAVEDAFAAYHAYLAILPPPRATPDKLAALFQAQHEAITAALDSLWMQALQSPQADHKGAGNAV